MPTVLIVAFAGRSKSGKTRLATQVARQIGAGFGSFGDVVRREAETQHLDPTNPDVLIALGSQIVKERCDWFCRTVILDAGWPSSEMILLDGIRHVKVVEAVKKLVAPAQFRLVMVSASVDSRLRRFQAAGPVRQTTLAQIDAHAISGETDALSRIADYQADGDGDDAGVVGTLTTVIAGWRSTGDSGTHTSP